MVSESEAEGWDGGFAEAQWRAVEKIANAWPDTRGPVSPAVPENVRILVKSLRNERGLVDLRDCRLVKAVAIDGW